LLVSVQREIGKRISFGGGEQAMALDPFPVAWRSGKIKRAVPSGKPIRLIQQEPPVFDDPPA